jgi:hypothetical protein
MQQAPAAAPEPPGQTQTTAPGRSRAPGQQRKAARTQTTTTTSTTTTAQARPIASAQSTTTSTAQGSGQAPATPPGQNRNSASATPPGQERKAAATTTTTASAPATPATTTAPAPRTARRLASSISVPGTSGGARRTATTAPSGATALTAPIAAALPAAATTTAGAGSGRTRTTPARHRVASGTPVRVNQPQNRGPVRVVTNRVTRTVRDIAHVIPGWVKALTAALGILLAVAFALILAAALRNRRLRNQRERLLADVGALQAALLPVVPAHVGELAVTVAYRPADGLAAGGDFYDVFPLEGERVGILVGDVSGHGRESLRAATFTRHMVRAYLEAGLGPREALQVAGNVVDQHERDEDFATLIAAVHDPTAGTLSYASAGHPPPIVLGPPRHRPVTVSSAPPIGVGFPTGQRQTVLPMPEGASVMIYSDGLLEARIDGVPLGPERLASWLEELGPRATAKEMLDRVVTRADRVPDDLAAVVLHAAPGATAPAARIEQVKLDVLDVDGPDLEGFLSAAGVSEVERLIAGRRVSELLASTSGVIVEVRTGEHPTVSVVPLGDDSGISSARRSARAR